MLIGIDTFSDFSLENNNVNSEQIVLSNAIISQMNINNASTENGNDVYASADIDNLDTSKWSDTSVILANFNNNLEYGATDNGGQQIEKIYIQRKLPTDEEWQTFYVKDYNGDSSLISVVDKFIENNTSYVYRIVPVSYVTEGTKTIEILGVPSNMSEATTYGSNNYIYDQTTRYAFNYDFELGGLKTIKPTNYIQTLQSKYPIVITNTATEYIQGSFKCTLVTDEESKYGKINLIQEYKNRMAIKAWLANGKPKILKTMDGTFMVINIDGEITLTPNNNVLGLYNLSFNFTEVGDATDGETLNRLGLIYEEETKESTSENQTETT